MTTRKGTSHDGARSPAPDIKPNDYDAESQTDVFGSGSRSRDVPNLVNDARRDRELAPRHRDTKRQAGGAAALSAARALTWDGHGTFSIGRSVAEIAGRWQLQLPDTAIVSMTYTATLGPSRTRAMVIASPRGWLVENDRISTMTEPVAANERNSFYLFDVMRLITLRNGAEGCHTCD